MDIYYLVFILPAVIITLWAQIKVKTTFNKYAKIYSQNGITAYDAVRKILDANGLTNVVIEHISGSLTDHYDPKERVIRLSDSVYSSMSVASIGVAAHEAGHAIQHAKSYAPLALRNTVYPVVNISSQAAIPLIFIGFLINSLNLVYLGIILFSVEQFRSAIHDRVKGNCATQAYGRTNAIEVSKPDYRYIPKVYQNMMTRLSPGEYIISNPALRSLVNVKFPRPFYKQFPNG